MRCAYLWRGLSIRIKAFELHEFKCRMVLLNISLTQGLEFLKRMVTDWSFQLGGVVMFCMTVSEILPMVLVSVVF